MYPLLVAAASTVAGKVIDNWSSAKPATSAPGTANFAAMLEKNAASSPSAASVRESQIATLRQNLMNSPEVGNLLAGYPPSKQPTLTLGPDGTLTAQTADGRTTKLLLSPATAATAHELATLTASQAPTRPAAALQAQAKTVPATSF